MDYTKNSQIDKLMELKQLYEQGILTKEEMEVEKQKIINNSTSKKPEHSVQDHEPRIEPVVSPASQVVEEDSIYEEDEEQSFFDKYKAYFVGGIALVLVIAGISFVPKIISHSNYNPASDKDIIEVSTSRTLALKGMVDDKIGFTMHLSISGNEIEGTEHYNNQRKEVNLVIKGVNNENGKMILSEYDGNTKAGTFEGILGGDRYSGTFTNSKGRIFPFYANVLTESALAKIEEEEKQFETTKIVYKNNTPSANVEISVDYPIKGNDALLQSTRKYINEIISKIFQIKGYEYRGSLNDGNSVITSYGKAKFDELSREWKEDEYERTSGYEESINLIKDYENDYCVSICSNSFYCHGGVGNSFCYAATFRKVDGKRISIFKSADDTGLQRLIVSALKNKIGEDYESVNDSFKSSPWPGLAHLVKDGVQLDYQHYEIGPGYFGQVSITIPYGEIMPYMTEEAKNIIN